MSDPPSQTQLRSVTGIIGINIFRVAAEPVFIVVRSYQENNDYPGAWTHATNCVNFLTKVHLQQDVRFGTEESEEGTRRRTGCPSFSDLLWGALQITPAKLCLSHTHIVQIAEETHTWVTSQAFCCHILLPCGKTHCSYLSSQLPLCPKRCGKDTLYEIIFEVRMRARMRECRY